MATACPLSARFLRWITGSEVVEVFARSRAGLKDADDYLIANLRFANGVDAVLEISWVTPPLSATSREAVFEVRGNAVTRSTITPFDLGLTLHKPEAIEGGNPQENAELLRNVFAGEGPLALRDLVCAQAGAGLYVAGLAASLQQGVELAIKAIEEGDAAARVGAFVEATRRLAK